MASYMMVTTHFDKTRAAVQLSDINSTTARELNKFASEEGAICSQRSSTKTVAIKLSVLRNKVTVLLSEETAM
jgi:hypothetical protein